jgi:putative NADH-flavin reductase
MNVLILGATGASGKLVTDKALAAGHDVTVYVRNPAKVSASGPALKVIEGQLADTAALVSAITGQDAVISLLGPSGRSSGTPYSSAMGEIVSAMERAGVRRLIATATPSDADPKDRSTLSFRLSIAMIKRFAGTAYVDLAAMGQIIRQSNLEWTIVRLPWLTSKPNRRPVAAGYLGDPGVRLFFLSRDCLADFLIGQLTDRHWIRQAPVISNG